MDELTPAALHGRVDRVLADRGYKLIDVNLWTGPTMINRERCMRQ
jgi:hypothetical protein